MGLMRILECLHDCFRQTYCAAGKVESSGCGSPADDVDALEGHHGLVELIEHLDQ